MHQLALLLAKRSKNLGTLLMARYIIVLAEAFKLFIQGCDLDGGEPGAWLVAFLAFTLVAAAIAMLIFAMTDRHWVVCTSKKVSNAFVQNTKREGDTTQHLTDDRSSPTRLSCRSHRHQASSRV